VVEDGSRDLDRVQRAIEEQEFARGHVPPGTPAVDPRPAATVCLARPAGGGFEVLLLQRPLASRFAAGAHVFPGGTIDPEDRSSEALDRLSSCAFESMTVRAALFAGFREAFEETGLLLASEGVDPDALGQVRNSRTALLEGSVTFARLLERSGVMLDAASAVYFARWITPVELDRRYDTMFFMARHPGGTPEITHEHTAFVWMEPAEALDRFRAGLLPMLFPTRMTLELLRRFDRLDEVFVAFREREVKPILARLIIEEGRIRPAPVELK